MVLVKEKGEVGEVGGVVRQEWMKRQRQEHREKEKKKQNKKTIEPVLVSPDIKHRESGCHQIYSRGSCCDRCACEGVDAQPF